MENRRTKNEGNVNPGFKTSRAIMGPARATYVMHRGRTGGRTRLIVVVVIGIVNDDILFC